MWRLRLIATVSRWGSPKRCSTATRTEMQMLYSIVYIHVNLGKILNARRANVMGRREYYVIRRGQLSSKASFTSPPNPKYFLLHTSHQIFRRMHRALNVGKKNN
jgi:hypothetical protein